MLTFWAVIPVLILFILLLVFKKSAKTSAMYSFAGAVVISLLVYKITLFGMSVSIGKGLSLSLFVALIIWSAIFLYQLVSETGAITMIHENISRLIQDSFIQFLLLSWVFSSFLQGVAGFGVPLVVVVPILIAMGFQPAPTAAAVLIGHSWAISFGSMGSSYYAIDLVTSVPASALAVSMALFGITGIFGTGITVCVLYGGISQIKKGLPYIVPATLIMGIALLFLARLEMMSLIGMVTALFGIMTILLLYRFRSKKNEKTESFKGPLSFFESVLPYLLILALSFLFYFLDLKGALSFDFPGYETDLGYVVERAEGYTKINYTRHPAAIILMASVCTIPLYWRKGVFDRKILRTIGRGTVKKCVPTTITLVFLLMTALLMMDSGMTQQLAETTAALSGKSYPLFAPFIGLLGAFITASNTNSNIIFGNFQETIALAIGANTAYICGVQSIGASIGGSIGPTTVLLAAAAAKLQGRESEIYNKTLLPTLLIVLALGVQSYIMVQ